jgi:hypothetical protein
MSDSPTPSSRFFAPWTVILGFVLGLALLAWLGKTSTRHDWHKQFTRFHPMIAPESLYEPSVDEMCAIVRARCRPDQILVIVGGNSILLGVGQPADRMWTRRLQALLGPHYAVINLAFRGASATDGGAIVAEALRKEFPHQIYIANAAVMDGVSSVGNDVYRFMLLDAYYKKMLLPFPPRDLELKELLKKNLNRRVFKEQDLNARVDAYLYFHDFWNHWSYTRFFTFPTSLAPDAPLSYWPRDRFPDAEPDYLARPFETRFTPEVVKNDLFIASKQSEAYYSLSSDGKWVPVPAAHANFNRQIREGFPEPLRSRTLILIGRSSSFYTQKLDPKINERDDIAYRDCVADWIAAGYQSIQYGRDFEPEDYGDRSHLTTLGGAKLAALVAPEVKTIAQKLGYPHP